MAIIGISGKIGSGKDTVGMIIQYLTSTADKRYSFDQYLEKYSQLGTFGVGYDPEWEIKKFAYKLKQIVSLLTGCTVNDLESQEFKNQPLGKEWDQSLQYNGKECHSCQYENNTYILSSQPTYRELLQVIGTEAMRNAIHENVWVNALFSDYIERNPLSVNFRQEKEAFDKEMSDLYPNWIITDMRFPNELKTVEDHNGITIRINRYDLSRGTIQEQKEWTKNNAHPSETSLDDANFKYTIDNNGTIEELIDKVKEILIKEQIITS